MEKVCLLEALIEETTTRFPDDGQPTHRCGDGPKIFRTYRATKTKSKSARSSFEEALSTRGRVQRFSH